MMQNRYSTTDCPCGNNLRAARFWFSPPARKKGPAACTIFNLLPHATSHQHQQQTSKWKSRKNLLEKMHKMQKIAKNAKCCQIHNWIYRGHLSSSLVIQKSLPESHNHRSNMQFFNLCVLLGVVSLAVGKRNELVVTRSHQQCNHDHYLLPAFKS